MKLEDKLKEFPDEFTLIMERAKELQFPNIVDWGLKIFGVEDDAKQMSDKEFKSFILFLRQIYNFGFYAGVNFTLDPEDYIKTYTIEDNKEETK